MSDLQEQYETFEGETDSTNCTIAVHESEEVDSPIVMFKSYSFFPRVVRDLLHNGDIASAHIFMGQIVCTDRWGEDYCTPLS